VGTNNKERLNDPEYLGWRHERITGQPYFDFVDQFVQARRLRCGDAFSGPGWSQDAGEHYRWCRSHDHAERDAMLERRQQALETCDQGRLDLRKIFKF